MENVKDCISKLKAEAEYMKKELKFMEEGEEAGYTRGYRDGVNYAISLLELELRQSLDG